MIAAALAFGALGDWLLDAVGMMPGAAAFAAGHVIAIALYLRNRRPRLTGSQTWLVLATVPLAIVIAWGLTRDAELSGAAVGYTAIRSEEHTSELQSLMRNSYAVFCLKTKKNRK